MGVYFSGGLDSELLLRYLFGLGLDITAISLCFDDGKSVATIDDSLGFISDLDIPNRVYDFSLKNYYSSPKFVTLSKSLGLQSVVTQPIIHHMKELKGFDFLIAGYMAPEVNKCQGALYIHYYCYQMALQKFMQAHKCLFPNFFPILFEINSAFLLSKTMVNWMKEYSDGLINSWEIKGEIYNKIIPLKKRIKKNGFEEYGDLTDWAKEKLIKEGFGIAQGFNQFDPIVLNRLLKTKSTLPVKFLSQGQKALLQEQRGSIEPSLQMRWEGMFTTLSHLPHSS